MESLSAASEIQIEIKCGELFYSKDAQKVTLQCIYCSKTCRKLGNFLKHLNLKHSQDIESLFTFDEDNDDEIEAAVIRGDFEETSNNEESSYQMFNQSDEEHKYINIDEGKDNSHFIDMNSVCEMGIDWETEIYKEECMSNQENEDEIEADSIKEESIDFVILEENSENNHNISEELKQTDLAILEENSENNHNNGEVLKQTDKSAGISEQDEICYSPNSDLLEISTKPKKKARRKYAAEKGNETFSIQLELIKHIQKNPILWNSTHEDYFRLILHKSTQADIAKELQNTFHTEVINRMYVKRKVSELFDIFRKIENGEAAKGNEMILYNRLQFLRGHLKEHLTYQKTETGLYACPICWKEYRDRNYVNFHIRRHEKSYSFKCEVCSKPFYRSAELQKHMLLHTEEKPFVCEVCGKEFRLRFSLTIHMKRHWNQRDFKCKICSKEYYSKETLKWHMKTHSSNPSERCKICDKMFYTKGNLNQHLKIHNTVKAYKCQVCDKAFTQLSGRSAHMKKHKLELSS